MIEPINTEVDKELVEAFVKLVDNPAMLSIQKKLEEMSAMVPTSPTYYAKAPDHAHVFSGYELAIEEITTYIFNHMKYAEEDTTKGREDAGE